MGIDENGIPLADVLGHISAQLHEANERARNQGHPTMRFQECELEFAVELEGKAGGGLQVYVVKLEAGAKRTEKNTIKIKYTALPDKDEVAAIEGTKPRSGKIKREGKKVE